MPPWVVAMVARLRARQCSARSPPCSTAQVVAARAVRRSVFVPIGSAPPVAHRQARAVPRYSTVRACRCATRIAGLPGRGGRVHGRSAPGGAPSTTTGARAVTGRLGGAVQRASRPRRHGWLPTTRRPSQPSRARSRSTCKGGPPGRPRASKRPRGLYSAAARVAVIAAMRPLYVTS